jgi:hypothetical protein
MHMSDWLFTALLVGAVCVFLWWCFGRKKPQAQKEFPPDFGTHRRGVGVNPGTFSRSRPAAPQPTRTVVYREVWKHTPPSSARFVEYGGQPYYYTDGNFYDTFGKVVLGAAIGAGLYAVLRHRDYDPADYAQRMAPQTWVPPRDTSVWDAPVVMPQSNDYAPADSDDRQRRRRQASDDGPIINTGTFDDPVPSGGPTVRTGTFDDDSGVKTGTFNDPDQGIVRTGTFDDDSGVKTRTFDDGAADVRTGTFDADPADQPDTNEGE